MAAIFRLFGRLVMALFLRPFRALIAWSVQVSRFRGVRLDGEAPDGRDIHIALSLAELCDGVTLGSEVGEPERVIAGERVSVRHVTLQLKGGVLYVRDEGSVHGSSLNARRLQPRRHEKLAHGDWLCLGGTVLRLTFH